MTVWHSLKGFGCHWVSKLPRSLYVAAAIASGVHILNSLKLPLELPATALLGGVAQIYRPNPPSKPDARMQMAVVEIDDYRFSSDYLSTSPLNRCTLREDLGDLLSNENLRVLAIDLDLSPIDPPGYQAAWRMLERGETTLAQLAERHRCQHELERFLNEKSQQVTIIAISPLVPTSGRDPALPWNNPVHFPRIQFGSPELDLRFGMLHDYEFSRSGLGGLQSMPFAELITRALCAESSQAISSNGTVRAAWLAQPKGCERVLSESLSLTQEASSSQVHTYPISHYQARYIYNGGFPIGLASPCVKGRHHDPESRADPCDLRVVILGGTYGVGDRYLTPVGERPGLQMQATIAAQIRDHTWHGLGFLGDVLLGGLVFGPLVHYLWIRYFSQRTNTSATTLRMRPRETAYLWLLFLGVIYTGVIFVASLICTNIYAHWGVWISPVPMALAMMFESAISGSVHAAVHKVDDEVEKARTTISGLERQVSELQFTLSGSSDGNELPSVQEPTPQVAKPWLAYLPRLVAIVLITSVVGGLAIDFFD